MRPPRHSLLAMTRLRSAPCAPFGRLDSPFPDDIAVVGYDDVPSAAFACPPLTTIRTHAYEHGKLFAEAAIRLMNQEEIASQHDALPLELVIRNSCGANSQTVPPRQQQLAETASTQGKAPASPAVDADVKKNRKNGHSCQRPSTWSIITPRELSTGVILPPPVIRNASYCRPPPR